MKKILSMLAAALLVAMAAPGAALAAPPPPPMETKLIVASFSLDRPFVLPGESCMLTFTLKNTNTKQYARNIAVTANPSDGALLCVKKNTLYIPRLNPGRSTECPFELKAAGAAAPGVRSVAVDIKYEDANGMPLSVQCSIPVEISAPAPAPAVIRLRADMPEALPANADEPVTVKMDVHNLGRDMLYNLAATAEGGSLKLLEDDYGGNLESGQSMTLELIMGFDGTVSEAVKKADAWKTVKPGDPAPVLEYPAEITLTYEDASGKEYAQSLAFAAKANIPRPDEPAYAVPERQAAAASAPDVTGWVVAGIALVAAACVSMLALWKARRQGGAR